MEESVPVYLTGIGTHVPGVVPVDVAVREGRYPADRVGRQGLLGAAVAGDVPAPELALTAAREAARHHGGPIDRFDLLLYVSVWHQAPDGWPPHQHLRRELFPDSDTMLAVGIQQGCNGAFAALQLAAAHLRGAHDPGDVLVVCADNFSTPMVDRWTAAPNLLMADGASAVALSRRPGFAELCSVRSITVAEAENLHRAGEPMFPPGATVGRPLDFTARAEAFTAANDASDDPVRVWLRVNQALVDAVDDAVTLAGIGVGDVARVAFTNLDRDSVHDRGMRAIGIPMSRSTWNYGRTVGHMGASDQLVSLAHLLDTGQLNPGDHVLLAGIGPGVTASAAVVRILAAQ